ncbi:hypothetical protein SAMN04488239_113146 [Ruegeria marina]|uniref:Uncharacterized protein n=1 Tax=Ruegeria marina TaxID=639004 RepID=A0A1G6ZYJ4_9RHOB|nr:hypothetical protein SAMN04488239_113146 [Ruegeria marina]
MQCSQIPQAEKAKNFEKSENSNYFNELIDNETLGGCRRNGFAMGIAEDNQPLPRSRAETDTIY